jgi:ferredoxin
VTREIRIDRDLCMGSGQCSIYAPAIFGQDDQLIGVVVDPDGDTDAALVSAMNGCPTMAISVDGD